VKTGLDLNAIKKELYKMTDVNYLKKELHKITDEIRKFDVQSHLTPQAKSRLAALEKRFDSLVKTIQGAQKQVDHELDKVKDLVKWTRTEAERRLRDLKARAMGGEKRRATKKKSSTRTRTASKKKKD
jgi:uncharacterized protein HemX